ncbi:hypothetical protein [Aquibacillus sediminis]|uniref:hypothetical protein n=1 Tax=Aquibacillus sediminis TaxID=2574734 RepID=UPI001108CA09|nr:hypothetical protein [Aquibacillus sediminis]
MEEFQGNIFSGELNETDHSFYLTSVKHLQTQSNLSEANIQQLYNHLLTQSKQEDTYTITLNDQIPLLLKKEEMQQLLEDLSIIKEKL